MKFPISRTDLYKELADLGYKESTRIDSPNQVLLTENKGIARNTITIKGSGITAMTGLTNQNPSIVVKNSTELVTYNTTYAKTSSLMLDAGLIDDTKLDQYITASGIDKALFIDTSLYSIEVTTEGNIKVNFTDIFDEGLILLPLVDGKAYQLDQLDKLGVATDPVLKFATGISFTKANVLANRKLVPGKTNTYFIPLVLKVTAVGEFPNFTVNAVEPTQSLANYLAIGPNELLNSALTVGWMGINAITDTQFRPSLASPLNVALSIRQFKVPTMPLTYASVAIIDALKAKLTVPTDVISYTDYTSTITGTSAESRTINIIYNEDYDKTKKQVLQVYTLPITDASGLSETVTAGDFNVLNVNNVLYKASEVIDRIIEDSGKFYIGFPLAITDMPSTTNFSLNVGGLNNPNTDWVETNWVTTVTQVIPQELVIPVTKLANKFVKQLSDVDGGFKSGIKHMRVEFDVPANQEFAYGYSDKTNLTIVDESTEGLFEVIKPTSTVAIMDQTLTDGLIIKNTTGATATLRLYIQVPMTSVNQSIGSNFLVESQTTVGAVFDLVNSRIKANGDYIFLKSQTANTTIDTLGYSHRYQRLISKNQAVQFKYNSSMAQSISFGDVSPLDHTDVTIYQSSVVSANQTKVLMTSDGYIYKVDETGFNQVDRVDIREGVYIEAAIDKTGTGLIITQYQYENDDVTTKPTILSVTPIPEVLGTVEGGYSVHVSALGLAKDAQLFLTDIYDVSVEIDCTGAISYAGVLTFNDEVNGTLENSEESADFETTEEMIAALTAKGLEVTELTEWTPPTLDFICAGASTTMALNGYPFNSGGPLFTLTINDLTCPAVSVSSFGMLYQSFRDYAEGIGRTDLTDNLTWWGDSGSLHYISNNSTNEKPYRFSIDPVPNSGENWNSTITEAGANVDNESASYDPETGKITFCLAPVALSNYIQYNGWFGEGWLGRHKYQIEVDGVVYEDDRAYGEDGALISIVGSLSDVLESNSPALDIFSTWTGSGGGGGFTLNAPGRHDIRFIKQPSTGTWEGEEDPDKIPSWSSGNSVEIDENGNWSFTLVY